MYKPKPGDRVKFVSYIKEQVYWGNNDAPDMLTMGETYTIETVDVHTSHTKVTLKNIPGRFNSVHFEEDK